MGNWWFGFLASPFHERARIPNHQPQAINLPLVDSAHQLHVFWIWLSKVIQFGEPLRMEIPLESWSKAGWIPSFSGDVGSSMACSCGFCGWRSVGRWDWRRLFMAHPQKGRAFSMRKIDATKNPPETIERHLKLWGKSLRKAVLKSHKFPSQPLCWKYMIYFLFLGKHPKSFSENSVAYRPVWRFDTIHPFKFLVGGWNAASLLDFSTLSDLVWQVVRSTVVETACSVWQIWEKSSWHTISGETWPNFFVFFSPENFPEPGDSKCPFHPLVGGHLTPWKVHLTIPKRSLWITRKLWNLSQGGWLRKRWSNSRSDFLFKRSGEKPTIS